ncbi:Ig-like domain-containing protein, partial [Anaerotignum lactatifermentans]|uniref:Ig-like domain-containing protein n=1 Tax=Anaerotignum lactatifermentans TaxID=160404 RepID=UPI00242C07E5
QSSLELVAGKEATLTATVKPDNATNKDVTWISEKPEIAAVKGGTVTAKAAGTAIIAVTTVDGAKTATCTVTVIPKTVQVSGIQVQGSASVYVGGSTKLTATVTPTNATNQKVTWSSNNESVATVGTDGTVTAVSAGTATITVTTEDGQKTAACTVTVLSVDRTKLFALLQGSGVLLATPTSADGSEFSSDQKWVTVAEKQALQTVADSAKTVYDSSTADKDTVDTAYRNLQTAVTTFQKAMKPGTKTETPAAASFWNFW